MCASESVCMFVLVYVCVCVCLLLIGNVNDQFCCIYIVALKCNIEKFIDLYSSSSSLSHL